MIHFLNEQLRTEFHSLPVDTQLEYQDIAMKFYAQGSTLTVCCIERYGKEAEDLEIFIRINRGTERTIS